MGIPKQKKYHVKIQRQRKRTDRVSVGLIFEGLLYVIIACSLDAIMKSMQVPYSTGPGRVQIALFVYGIGKVFWGLWIR